jgi:hypothetical protein
MDRPDVRQGGSVREVAVRGRLQWDAVRRYRHAWDAWGDARRGEAADGFPAGRPAAAAEKSADRELAAPVRDGSALDDLRSAARA